MGKDNNNVMKKTISIIVFLSVIFMGFISYFSVSAIDMRLNAMTPNYSKINSAELMKLEKRAIISIAEGVAQNHILLANKSDEVNTVVKKLLLIFFSISCLLSLAFIYFSFTTTKTTKNHNTSRK